jgi:colanic acid biosynthesis glycosyl transferase WcaI
VIVTAWFPPEPAPYGQMMYELAQHLAACGLSVDVITSVPNHPQGIPYAGWRNRLLQEESPMPGLRVLRIGVLPRRSTRHDRPRGILNRSLAFLWFTATSFLVALVKTRPHAIFAVLQPLTVAVPMVALAALKRAALVFNVQDLHPDALVALGLIRQPWLVAILRRLERLAYRRSDAIAVISEGFRLHCVARGANPDRVRVIPNWIDLDEVRPRALPSRLRAQLGLQPGDFVALYAGTIGLVSGADVVLEAAVLLRDSDVNVVFVGDGQLVPRLQSEARSRSLENVRFLPFQPRELLSEVQSLGDVSLVTMLPGHGTTSVPSKILGYLAAARPIVAAVDDGCETARFLRTAAAGVIVPPNDPRALANAILSLRDDPERARRMGAAGRRYLEDCCAKDGILAQHEELLRDAAAGFP